MLALLAGAFYAGLLTGRNSASRNDVVNRIDTVYYEHPHVVESLSSTVSVNVPKWLFASPEQCANIARSNMSEKPTRSQATEADKHKDSVQISVDVTTRIYEDSLYRAQVSGPVVGPLQPQLDWVQVYNTTRTVTRQTRFAVTAGAGVAYTPQGFQPTIGVQIGVVLFKF